MFIILPEKERTMFFSPFLQTLRIQQEAKYFHKAVLETLLPIKEKGAPLRYNRILTSRQDVSTCSTTAPGEAHSQAVGTLCT